MQNDVYLWTRDQADDVVIKLYMKKDRRRLEREWSALNLLADHGLDTVPAPLWLDTADEEPAIGMTRLHGEPVLDAEDQLGAVRELAWTTAQLQQVPLTGLLAELPRIDTGEHYVLRLTQEWPRLLASQPGDLFTPAMHQLLAHWRDSPDAELVAADGLGGPRVFSRGDSNLLNWMITDQGRAACVDFEYAGYSSVAFDAADHIEHISARAVPDHIWSALLPDLGITRTNRAQFAASQRICALRWLAVLWKRRDTRREEFAVQLDRVRLLYGSSNPYN
ncbi:aminoglycoside phosphotransferase family protein [Kineosporia sp. J2-2]|uniref:Aminoglycoside phosphotransferase family protein n=2 Tax=Kineosporia corallincola TaxID=2835133 RepID=A0ABS5TTR3_9ACTN|nr:aminoglycoside phosphotransferase family protein [Kineosporia corallincola]